MGYYYIVGDILVVNRIWKITCLITLKKSKVNNKPIYRRGAWHKRPRMTLLHRLSLFLGSCSCNKVFFSNFSCMFLNPNNFFHMNYHCSNLLDMRNLQEQFKKALCYQKLFWPVTVWINCSCDFKNFANSRPSASNFKSFSWYLEQFFLTVGQNNFGNKIPLSISDTSEQLILKLT